MKLQEARRRIQTAQELEEIVRTLRVLSRSRLVQAQRLTSSIDAYEAGVRGALDLVLQLVPLPLGLASPGAPAAVLVLGAEHGFVGTLDARLLDEGLAAARALEAEGSPTRVLLVGSRLVRRARERGVAPSATLRGPSSVGGVSAVARALADAAGDLVAGGQAERVVLVGASRDGALAWSPRREVLHPLEGVGAARPPGRGPRHHLPPAELLERAARQVLVARLTRAVADAFMVEQSQRLVTLDGMRRALDDRLGDLQLRERLLRQEAITSELLDILGGAQALEGGPGDEGGDSAARSS